MTDEKNLPEPPVGWVWTKVKYICDLINGRAFKPNEWTTEGLPIIRIQNLNNPEKPFNYCNFQVDSKYYIKSGDLLFAWSGTPGTSFGAHIWNREDAVLNQHIFRVEINDDLLTKLFFMYLINNNLREYISKAHGTAGLAHITKKKFDNSFVAIPPLPEQHRIVAKIEKLFTRLDAGVSALTTLKTQLKRYRQAVLKSAMEGKLTAKWREEHKGELEPASELLERIKGERKKRLGKKYKEMPPVEKEGLAELPDGWEWVRVEDISLMKQYGTSEKAIGDSTGIPVLRMGNIDDGRLIFKKLKYYPKDWPELDKFLLKDGDVLFNRTNSAELVGKTAVYKEYHPASVFASYLIRVQVDNKLYHPDLLGNFINSFYGRKYINSVVSQQVGQANVNGTKLYNMPLVLPPIKEQKEIIERIENRFSILGELDRILSESLTRAERLRQSILRRAFEGKLVPQDPTEEPASMLLERIREEKFKIESKSKGKRRRRL